MNLAIWLAQGLVCAVALLTGSLKLIVPRRKLAARMHWAETWTDWQVKLLGLAEVLGAVGIVVPAASGIAPWLTPAAALALLVLMVGAVRTHRRLGEPPTPAIVVGLLCAVVAVGRLPLFGVRWP